MQETVDPLKSKERWRLKQESANQSILLVSMIRQDLTPSGSYGSLASNSSGRQPREDIPVRVCVYVYHAGDFVLVNREAAALKVVQGEPGAGTKALLAELLIKQNVSDMVDLIQKALQGVLDDWLQRATVGVDQVGGTTPLQVLRAFSEQIENDCRDALRSNTPNEWISPLFRIQ